MNKRNHEISFFNPVFTNHYFVITKFLVFFLFSYISLLYFNIHNYYILLTSIILIPLAIFTYFKEYLKISYLIFVILISNFTYINFKNDNYQSDISYFNNQEVLIDGVIDNILFESDQSITFVADAKIDSKFMNEFNSKILMVLFKFPDVNINIGEHFKAKSIISSYQDKVFPEEFPSKLYAISNGVNFHAITKQKDFFVYKKASTFYQYANSIKQEIIYQIRYLFPEDVANIIIAITTGNKSYLNKEEKENHSLAGTSHIIAVSGLHVGVIALFLFSMMFFIKNEWTKSIIVILVVCIYVFATGLQASAIRAAIMISLLLIAKASNRKIEYINILSASALLFILISPEIIFSISFQLSVAALLGIILYTDLILQTIVKLLKIENKFLYNSLNILSVTIAAMMFLSPISAYYFNTFSIIGLIANFYAIPFISLSLILSIPTIIFSFVNFNIAFFFSESITLMIRTIDYLNTFFLQIEFLYFKTNLSILYATGFLLIILIYYHSHNWKSRIIGATISSVFIFTLYLNFSQNEFYRDNYTYKYLLKENKNSIDLVLIDKNKNNVINIDRDLYSYLISKKTKKLNLKFNDNNGQNLYDKLKDSMTIDTSLIRAGYPF